MKQLALHTSISLEQLYSLLAQLSDEEKLTISKRLKAEVAKQKWSSLSKSVPKDSAISSEEIISEIKLVRQANSGGSQPI